MKKLLFIVICLLTVSSVQATNYGIVDRTATRDTIAVNFQFLDTLGEAVDDAVNDSVYIIVFSPGGVEVFRDSMLATDASITASAWEDFAGGNHYVYKERISVLDGSSTSDGVFSIQGVAWDNSLGLQSHFYGTFQVINSTLDGLLDSIGTGTVFSSQALDSLADVLDSLEAQSTWIQDSLYAIIDSLQSQDDWVAKEASLFDGDLSALGTLANQVLIIDTVNGIMDTLQLQDDWVAKEVSLFDPTTDIVNQVATVNNGVSLLTSEASLIADSVWLSLLAARDGVAGSFGDSAQGWGATAAGGSDATAANQLLIIDTVNAIIDTLQNHDNWVAKEASLFDGDLSSLATAANLTLVIDTVNGIIDTLQNQDNWVAQETSLFDGDLSALATLANQTLIIDTVNAILDTLQLQDGWISRATQIDTLLMYMGFNSTSSRSTNGTDATTDTLHIFEGATEIRRLLFWHIGGAAGDAPDSVTVAL